MSTYRSSWFYTGASGIGVGEYRHRTKGKLCAVLAPEHCLMQRFYFPLFQRGRFRRRHRRFVIVVVESSFGLSHFVLDAAETTDIVFRLVALYLSRYRWVCIPARRTSRRSCQLRRRQKAGAVGVDATSEKLKLFAREGRNKLRRRGLPFPSNNFAFVCCSRLSNRLWELFIFRAISYRCFVR